MNEKEMLVKQRDEINKRIRKLGIEAYYADVHRKTDDTKKVFAERLANLCRSKKKLASYLGVQGSVITRYTSGSHLPRLVHLIGIANYFDVSVDYLLGRTENKAVAVQECDGLLVDDDDDDEEEVVADPEPYESLFEDDYANNN